MRLRIAAALACLLFAVAPAVAQRRTAAAGPPLPPVRPFDLDKSEWLPEALRNPQQPSGAVPGAIVPAEEEDDIPPPPEGAPAEPLFDPDERPAAPGLSTDKGTSVACAPERLMRVLQQVILRYGSVRVTSTWRPPHRARRKSYHRSCQAVDFRVPGVHPSTVIAFIRDNPDVGGRKVYWNGLIHIDTGPARTW